MEVQGNASLSLAEKRQEKDFTAEELVAIAKANHIWLNAFSCIRQTPEFLQAVGAQVISCLQTSPIYDDWISAPKSVTYIRVNRS